jgi:hypothetical protein
MPRVRFDPTTQVFEKEKTVHVLGRVATVIGSAPLHPFQLCCYHITGAKRSWLLRWTSIWLHENSIWFIHFSSFIEILVSIETSHCPVILPRVVVTSDVGLDWRIDLLDIRQAEGHTVGLLVETLCYKPEGRGFVSQWGGFFFNLRNISIRTMALSLTQPLTDMSTRNVPWW